MGKKVIEKIPYSVVKEFKLNDGTKFEVKQTVAEADFSQEYWTVLVEMEAVQKVEEVKADGENS